MSRREAQRLVDRGLADWIEGGDAIAYRRTGLVIRFLDPP